MECGVQTAMPDFAHGAPAARRYGAQQLAGGEVAEQGRPALALGHRLAGPHAGEQGRRFLSGIGEVRLGRPPGGELAHPAVDADVDDKGAHAGGLHPQCASAPSQSVYSDALGLAAAMAFSMASSWGYAP